MMPLIARKYKTFHNRNRSVFIRILSIEKHHLSKMKGILSLLFLITAICGVQSRPPTKCDIDAINKLIHTLKQSKLRIQHEIGQIKKRHGWLKTDLEKNERYLNNTINAVQKQIKQNQASYEKHAQNQYAWFKRMRERTVNVMVDKLFKNESGGLWSDAKALRVEDDNIKWKQLRVVVRNISAINNWRRNVTQIKRINAFKKDIETYEGQTQSDLKGIDDELYLVSRQTQLQQFNEFEKARSDGNTGIKQIRSYQTGAKNYFSSDHSGSSVAGVFDKAFTKNKLGVGDFIAVMNGIEFRTKEAEYELRKPVSNDIELHKTEAITMPSTPNGVSDEKDISKQIVEMRLWFKAFQNQDAGLRNYKNYFKPILSYLEGAWMTGEIDAAESDEAQFISQTGFTSSHSSYRPSKIMGFDKNKNPLYSKWNYRMLCHQIKSDLPTSYLKFVHDTVSSRRHEKKSTQNTRTARFDLAGLDVNGYRRAPGKERPMYYTYLDALMEEVPGKDNYGANIMANGFDAQIKSAHPKRSGRNLNGANYHRPYKLSQKDAMGVDTAQRSYSDILYVALTKQDKVSGPKITFNNKNIHIRASYALPFEIVYLTPLQEWNPFDIPHVDDCKDVTGKGTKIDPFDATCSTRFFRTPQAFFLGGNDVSTCQKDPEGHDSFYFKSSNGPVCLVASGVRNLLPPITGIEGRIRQRYPIAAINGEGSSVWKKLNAIEDMIDLAGEISVPMVTFTTGEATKANITIHSHDIAITKDQYDALLNGKIDSVKKATQADDKHQHILTLKVKIEGGKKVIYISSCDSGPPGTTKVCFDSHWNTLTAE